MLKFCGYFLSIALFSVSVAGQAKKKTNVKQAARGAGITFQKKSAVSIPGAKLVLEKKSPKTDLNLVKPPRTSIFMEEAGMDDKAQLERITDQQIAELYKLAEKFKTSSRRGEIWLRLAELYVEKAGLIEFKKQTDYDHKLKEYQEGRSKIKPGLNLDDAREFNKKAIQLYDWFVRDFPRDEKMDQALFFLGYNNYEIGSVKKGTEYYTRLTKNYPQSAFITESHFALAEYYFENENWRQALNNYQAVTKNRRHRLSGFSTYKLAWCQFRLGYTSQAQKTLEYLVKSNRSDVSVSENRKSVNKVRLEHEALRDLVTFYSEIGSPQNAPRYFEDLAGAKSEQYVEKLAYFYNDKGNREGARVLFNYLIKKNPTSPKAIDYKHQIVVAFAAGNKTREFREELYSFIKEFGSESVWAKANANQGDLVANSEKLREQSLRNWTLQQHQTAQNSRTKFSQSLAMEGYRLYHQEFASAAAAGDMHFYYAELLYDMERFDEAGTHYRWVVENAPQNKYAIKAAENIVLALEKNIPKDTEIAKIVGRSVEPVAFSQKTEKFIQACQWYLGKFPNTDKAAEIKFRIGRLNYQHNKFDQALPYFREIVTKYPKTKYAEYSANLMLDVFNLKKDYAGLEKMGAELLSMPNISQSAAGKDIKSVLERASFKKAQDLEVAKDYQKSAEQFEIFAMQNPSSALSMSARFNAAINFERAGFNSKAINNHMVVLNQRSPADMKVKSRRILAKLQQDSGQIEAAAANYAISAQDAGKDPLAANLHFNAAILYQALGKRAEAIRQYEAYIAKVKFSERSDALYQLAQIHRNNNQISRAVDRYKEFIDTNPSNAEQRIEAAFYIYTFSKALNRGKDTSEWRRKTLSMQKAAAPQKKGVGASYVSKILLEDAELFYRELRAVKISANPARQKETVQKKISLMTQLNSQLSDIIKYDSADEIVAALYLLAQSNLHLGQALIDTPVPKGLNADETKQYKAGVQQIAEPFVKKGRESLKAAFDRAYDLDVYNETTKKIIQNLKQIEPAYIADHGEKGFDVKQGAWL